MLSNLLVRFSSRLGLVRQDVWCIAERHLSYKGGVRNGGGFFSQFPTSGSANDRAANGGEGGGGKVDGSDENHEDLFSEENMRDVSPGDIAKLRLTFGLVREHIEAREQGKDVDSSSNPLLDPRSFEIRRLPKVPPEVLKHFRKELPASEVEQVRPVATRTVWDSQPPGEVDDLVTESLPTNAMWDQVDARTMPMSRLNRRSRLTLSEKAQGSGSTMARSTSAMTDIPMTSEIGSKRMTTVLRTNNGRVGVDVRALNSLNAFLSDTGKILPRRKSGLSPKSQRRLAKAVKTARHMALLHPEPKGPSLDELLEMSGQMTEQRL